MYAIFKCENDENCGGAFRLYLGLVNLQVILTTLAISSLRVMRFAWAVMVWDTTYRSFEPLLSFLYISPFCTTRGQVLRVWRTFRPASSRRVNLDVLPHLAQECIIRASPVIRRLNFLLNRLMTSVFFSLAFPARFAFLNHTMRCDATGCSNDYWSSRWLPDLYQFSAFLMWFRTHERKL